MEGREPRRERARCRPRTTELVDIPLIEVQMEAEVGLQIEMPFMVEAMERPKPLGGRARCRPRVVGPERLEEFLDDKEVVIPEPEEEENKFEDVFHGVARSKKGEQEVMCGVLPCGHGVVGKDLTELETATATGCRIVKRIEYECGHKAHVECSEFKKYSKEAYQCYLDCYRFFEGCDHFRFARIKEVDENGLEIKPQCESSCERTKCRRGVHSLNRDKSHPCKSCPPCQEIMKHDLPCGHMVEQPCYMEDPKCLCNERPSSSQTSGRSVAELMEMRRQYFGI